MDIKNVNLSTEIELIGWPDQMSQASEETLEAKIVRLHDRVVEWVRRNGDKSAFLRMRLLYKYFIGEGIEVLSLMCRTIEAEGTLSPRNRKTCVATIQRFSEIEQKLKEGTLIDRNDFWGSLNSDLMISFFLCRHNLDVGPKDEWKDQFIIFDTQNPHDFIRPTPAEEYLFFFYPEPASKEEDDDDDDKWDDRAEIDDVFLASTEVDLQSSMLDRLYFSTDPNGRGKMEGQKILQLRTDIAQHRKYRSYYRVTDRVSDENLKSIEDYLEERIRETLIKNSIPSSAEYTPIRDFLRNEIAKKRAQEKNGFLPTLKVNVTHNKEREELKVMVHWSYQMADLELSPKSEEIPADEITDYILTTKDLELYGYTKYDHALHGNAGRFFLRYGPSDWFREVIVPQAGRFHFKLEDTQEFLSPDGTIHTSLHNCDPDGYTIWERFFQRLEEEGIGGEFSWMYLLTSAFENFIGFGQELYYDNEESDNGKSILVPINWDFFRRQYPFFLQNEKTGDTFFHVLFRGYGTNVCEFNEISNLLLYLAAPCFGQIKGGFRRAMYWLLAKCDNNAEIEYWCREVVRSDEKTSINAAGRKLYAAEHSRKKYTPEEILQRLNVVHGFFTMENHAKETAMEIFVKRLKDWRGKSIGSVHALLMNILLGVVQLYEITEYDNLLLRFDSLFGEEQEQEIEMEDWPQKIYLPNFSKIPEEESESIRKREERNKEQLSTPEQRQNIQKIRFQFHEKLKEIIERLFGRKIKDGIPQFSIFENLMESRMLRNNSKLQEVNLNIAIRKIHIRVESLVAKLFQKIFFLQDRPMLRKWWFEAFGKERTEQIDGLTRLIVGLVYHDRSSAIGIVDSACSIGSSAPYLWRFERDVKELFTSSEDFEATLDELLKKIETLPSNEDLKMAVAAWIIEKKNVVTQPAPDPALLQEPPNERPKGKIEQILSLVLAFWQGLIALIKQLLLRIRLS